MLFSKLTTWTDNLHLVLAIGTPADVDKSHRQNAVCYEQVHWIIHQSIMPAYRTLNHYTIVQTLERKSVYDTHGYAFWKLNVLWGHEKYPDFAIGPQKVK